MDLKKIEWSEKLSVGNKTIDNDHKKLFEIYNDLVDLIELNKSREEFAKILSEMTDYVLNHFKKEEIYMQEFSYPKFLEHKQYHLDYNYKVALYNYDLLSNSPPDPKTIIKFIEDWWINHILKADTEYENYRKKICSNAMYIGF